MKLRPLRWRVTSTKTWDAHAFAGAVVYRIRELRSGQFAPTIMALQYDALPTFEEAAALCENDRMNRIKHELGDQNETA